MEGKADYKTGLDEGDGSMRDEGKDVTDAKSLTDIVDTKNIGDKLVVNYKNRTGDHETTVILEENPALEVVTNEKAGKELTKEQGTFRNNWLSTKVK